jgi:hypothetical protein
MQACLSDPTAQMALYRDLFTRILDGEDDEMSVLLAYDLTLEAGLVVNLRCAMCKLRDPKATRGGPLNLLPLSYALELDDGTLLDRHLHMGAGEIEQYAKQQAGFREGLSWEFEFWGEPGDGFYAAIHRERHDTSFHLDWNLNYTKKLERYRALFQAYLLAQDTDTSQSDTPHSRL